MQVMAYIPSPFGVVSICRVSRVVWPGEDVACLEGDCGGVDISLACTMMSAVVA